MSANVSNQPVNNMSRYLPYRKVTASTLAVAVASLAIWILTSPQFGINLSIDQGMEGTITTLFTFLVGYLVPESTTSNPV